MYEMLKGVHAQIPSGDQGRQHHGEDGSAHTEALLCGADGDVPVAATREGVIAGMVSGATYESLKVEGEGGEAPTFKDI
jgi:hypothetical protein